MYKAIIVGGAGFIGSNVVDHIVDGEQKWDEIVVIDNLSTGKKGKRKSKSKINSC